MTLSATVSAPCCCGSPHPDQVGRSPACGMRVLVVDDVADTEQQLIRTERVTECIVPASAASPTGKG